jgi:hypothetical protein
MPIVDRGGLGELGDQLAGLLYSIASSTSTVRRGGLSTSTSATLQLPRRWLRVKRLFVPPATLVATNLGPDGIKPTEAKKSSIAAV